MIFSSRAKKMRQVIAFLALTGTIMIAAEPLAAHEGGADEDVSANAALSAEAKQVIDTLHAYAAAVQSTDLEKIAGFMVTDTGFSSIEGTFTDIGWESYRDHLAPELAMFEDTQYTLSDIRPYVSGEMAYASFDYAMDVTVISEQFEGGAHPVSMRGKATVVLVRDREEWKIRHLHTVTKREQKPDAASEH